MPTFITPTTLRLTSNGIVNIDFLSSDNTFRLISGGILGRPGAFNQGTPTEVRNINFGGLNVIDVKYSGDGITYQAVDVHLGSTMVWSK